MIFQKAFIPYCVTIRLLNYANWTYRNSYHMKKSSQSSCPKQGLRLQTTFSNLSSVHHVFFFQLVVHIYRSAYLKICSSTHFYYIQLQELALLSKKSTLQETGKTCSYVWNTDTTVTHSLPTVTGVSQGPDLASKPYVTRLKAQPRTERTTELN